MTGANAAKCEEFIRGILVLIGSRIARGTGLEHSPAKTITPEFQIPMLSLEIQPLLRPPSHLLSPKTEGDLSWEFSESRVSTEDDGAGAVDLQVRPELGRGISRRHSGI